MQEDLHLPYILGFRAAHYFVVWCNPPLLRTAFFAAAGMLMLRIAYLTIQASTTARARCPTNLYRRLFGRAVP